MEFHDKLMPMPAWKGFILNLRRFEGVIASLTTVITVVYTVWITTRFYEAHTDAYVSFIGLTLINLAAAVLGLRIFLSKDFLPRWKWGWFFIALGALSNAVAEFLWFHTSEVLGIEPYPSLADVFYLLYYPFVLIGITIFPFERHKRQERYIFLLDLLIILVFGAMILWNFLIIDRSEAIEQTWEGFFAFAYPLGDLLLLVGLLALLQHDWEPDARGSIVYLSISFAFMALADFLFAFFENLEFSYSLSPLNALFMASALFLVFAAARLSSAPEEEKRSAKFLESTRRLLRLGMPYLAAVLGPILLLYAAGRTGQINLQLHVLLLGTASLICLVMFRQYLVLVENERLYREMRRLAATDSLTGIYNRHFFHEVLAREIQRAERYRKPFSILLIDVDDFKLINDRLGHLQGDVVLSQIAQELSANLRKSDLLARFGGDEFVIILPETEQAGASVVKEKLKQAIAQSKILSLPTRISVGLTTYRSSMTVDQLLHEADVALYQSKKQHSSNADE